MTIHQPQTPLILNSSHNHLAPWQEFQALQPEMENVLSHGSAEYFSLSSVPCFGHYFFL